MGKKAFTLIELLGVIILIALISFLAFPTILNKIKETKDVTKDTTITLIKKAADDYVSDNPNIYKGEKDKKCYVKISKLISNGYIDESFFTGDALSYKEKYLEVTYSDKFYYKIINRISVETCTE